MSTSLSDNPDLAVAPVIDYLRDYQGSFWVVGGWAIDLHLGRVTRPHKDVDIAMRADDQQLLEAWIAERDVFLENPMTGDRRPWVDRAPLRPGPDALVLPDAPMAVQLLPALFENNHWVFPRGRHSIRMDIDSLTKVTPAGTPYQTPEVILLYKSRQHRAEDDADFHNLLPVLTERELQWLRDRVARRPPDDPWLSKIDHRIFES